MSLGVELLDIFITLVEASIQLVTMILCAFSVPSIAGLCDTGYLHF